MDRVQEAWHNDFIAVGLSVFDDRFSWWRKEFASEVLFGYVVNCLQFIAYQ
jgi:hypothetical protein